MKTKRLAWLLAVVLMMTGILTSCGNANSSKGAGTGSESKATAASGEGSDSRENSTESVAGKAAEQPSEAENAASDSSAGVSWEDMADIQVVCIVNGTIPSGLSAVEAEINKITENEINTHVNLNLFETGAYAQQMNLMMSSNEAVDLMVTLPGGPCSFTTMASQSQLMDITDLAAEYAPGVLKEQEAVLRSTTINGKLYGIPANKAFVTAVNIYMRTDVLEDLGLLEKAQNMQSFSEYEEILETVKNSDKWGYLAGIVAQGSYSEIVNVANSLLIKDKFSDCAYYDNLGDNMSIVGVYADDETSTVFNFFGSDEYRTLCDIAKEWYEKGYIYRDSATTQEMAPSLIKSDVAFSFLSQTEIGSENAVSINCGTPITTVQVVKLPIATSSVTKFVWAIPNTAKEPEAAMAFYNMAYADPRIANLLAWGIEGVDYEIKENGTAGFIDGNTSPAYQTGDTCWPNKLMITPWENDEPTLRERQREARANADYSRYLGFSCDTSGISTELGSVSGVIEEFKKQLNAGVAPAGTLDAFIEKLEASGVNVIVDEYQKQLNAWLENN